MSRRLLPALLLLTATMAVFVGTRAEDQEGCTIGVACGRATDDGRPLLWKTRDANAIDNEVRYIADAPIPFVAVFTVGGVSPWMAVNERGFALVNANSLDLPGPGNSGNGSFMRHAMGSCATVRDFTRLLDSTNATGRQTQAHFAVIDTAGGAVLFETGGNHYWEYDARDRETAPGGYVLRTNFAVNGAGTIGIERYRRTSALISMLQSEHRLGYRSVIQEQVRDFSDADGTPFPVPFPDRRNPALPIGFIPSWASICRDGSVSAAVIQGVARGEPALTTTMWTLLGQPACAIAVPVWPAGAPPRELGGNPTSPLCDAAKKHKTAIFRFAYDPVSGRVSEYAASYLLRDGSGCGLWAATFTAEHSMFQEVERHLADWRQSTPDRVAVLELEQRMAIFGLSVLRGTPSAPAEQEGLEPVPFVLAQNYPNPFNPATVITFAIPTQNDRAGTRSAIQIADRHDVSLQVFDILGERVATLVDDSREPGTYTVTFDASTLAGGTYLYRLTAGGYTATRRMMLLK